MRRATLASLWLLSSCAPDADVGTLDRVYLQRPHSPPGTPEGGTADGAADAAPPLPPSVVSFGPTTGEHGTEIVIAGEALGSATTGGVSITLSGTDEVVIEPDSAYVVAWTESEIRLRFPFPLGPSDVTVTTPAGAVTAGTFTPTWTPGVSSPGGATAAVVASVATGPGTIAALFSGSSLRLVETDGTTWAEVDITVAGALADTARLYLDEQSALSGFVLSSSSPPEIFALTEATGTWTATPTGVAITAEFAISGGPNGAAVWYRDSANDWYRARPTTGTWSTDLGPVADPVATASSHAAATSSDGGLTIGYARGTGNLLDDRGAPFLRVLDLASLSFAGEVRAGLDVDDAVAGLEMVGRGGGIILGYVGNQSGSEWHAAAWPALGPSRTRIPPESETVRYAFNAGIDAPVGAAYCSSALGTRRIPGITANRTVENDLDAETGETLAWPCATTLAAEFDPAGQLLVLVEHDGQMYLPRPRVP